MQMLHSGQSLGKKIKSFKRFFGILLLLNASISVNNQKETKLRYLGGPFFRQEERIGGLYSQRACFIVCSYLAGRTISDIFISEHQRFVGCSLFVGFSFYE